MKNFNLHPYAAAVLLFFCSCSLCMAGKDDDVKRLVNAMTVEEMVGQVMMVGVPVTVSDYYDNKFLKKIIGELHIGNIFVNKHNFRSKYNNVEEMQNKIIDFNNKLQSLSYVHNRKIPLYIASDFESVSICGLENKIYPPIESLTLSMLDGQRIKRAGKLLSYQLSSLGINMILGPVVDIDQCDQGNTKSVSYNRVFGGSNSSVLGSVSYYVSGLKESGIQVVGKHFPGHYGTKIHSDLGLPESNKSPSEIVNEVIPYPQLRDHLDGVMTAHIEFSIAKTVDPRSQFVTVSKLFVDELLRGGGDVVVGGQKCVGLNYANHLVITDDLGAKAVDMYIKRENKTISYVAINALLAGHDMLLFGSVSEVVKKSWKTQDIVNIHSDLVRYFKENERDIYVLRRAVERILNKKSELFKLSSYGNLFSSSITQCYSSDLQDQSWIKKEGYNNVQHFYLEIAEKSMTSINNGDSISTRFDRAKNVMILTSAVGEVAFRGLNKKDKNISFSPNVVREYERIELLNDANDQTASNVHGNVVRVLENIVKNNDLIILTVSRKSDAEIVNDICAYDKGYCSSNVIVFLHCSPKVLSSNVLPLLMIAGNFSNIKESYDADVGVVNCAKPINSIDRLPIRLDAFHSIKSASVKAPDSIVKLNPGLGTPEENETIMELQTLRDVNKKLEDTVESKNKENNELKQVNNDLSVKSNMQSQGIAFRDVMLVLLLLFFMVVIFLASTYWPSVCCKLGDSSSFASFTFTLLSYRFPRYFVGLYLCGMLGVLMYGVFVKEFSFSDFRDMVKFLSELI